jgi:LPXTG-motif cell wall-anchored protein
VSLDGKSLIVKGVPVPVPTLQIAAVKSAVGQVLTASGLSVGLCDAAKNSAAKDGTSASQTVSALRIQFAPLAVADVEGLGIVKGTPLVKVLIDPSVATSVSAKVTAVAPAALPRTGPSPLPLIIMGSIVMAGALLFLLRRRLAPLLGARSS